MTPTTPRQDWEHLGRVIKRTRREAGFRSQGALAKATGLSLKTISNYENGRRPDTAPEIPNGYHLVAKRLGWAVGCLEHVLAGGQPEDFKPATADGLGGPVFDLLDTARDAGAPLEMVQRARAATLSVLGWLMENTRQPQQSDYRPAAYRPHAEGEGPAVDDAERGEQAANREENGSE